jgi:methylase of polypeptide subunit release factors
VLDVAGGSGGLSIQIGLKYPHLHGIIMDLPPVCKVAEEYIQASGLTARFTTAAADLFTGPYPSGADAIILSVILHD